MKYFVLGISIFIGIFVIWILSIFIYKNKSEVVVEQDSNKIQKNIQDLAETGSDISLLDVNKFKVRI